MGKSRLIIGILIVVCAILCMFTIYKHTQYNNMRIAYNIKDRESITLKKDYEKLYKAYYDYGIKEKKLLSLVDSVFWADDSSAYIIKTNQTILFAFFKKPQNVAMTEHHLWGSDDGKIGYHGSIYLDLGRVDTLKPHQFYSVHLERWTPLDSWTSSLFVAPVICEPPVVKIDVQGNKVPLEKTDPLSDTLKRPDTDFIYSTIHL